MPPGGKEGGAENKKEGIDDWASLPSPGGCRGRVYPSTLGILLPRQSTLAQQPTTLSIHALVRLPAHAQLSGWSQEESVFSGGSPKKGLTEQACMNELRLVAYAFGRRLTTKAREQKEQVVELEQASGQLGKLTLEPMAERLCKVDITVPNDLASVHSTPCPLNLELWQHDSLLGDSCVLLIPTSMPSVAAEIRSLPCGCDGNEDVEEFVADLGRWQRSHQHMGTAKSAGLPGCKDALAGWEAGALLVRQAVVRGLPAVATLLVETLMALPHPTANPFVQLARAHAHSCSGDAGADGTAILGGLLHLALLSPCSTTMLWTVLDWGKQRGGEGDASMEGTDFAWDWGEQNAAGDTPLLLVEQQPKGAYVLQVLLEDPQQGPSVRAAAQHECRGTEVSTTQTGGLIRTVAASNCPNTSHSNTSVTSLGPNTGVQKKLPGALPNHPSVALAPAVHNGSSKPEEAEFREWVRMQSMPLAKLCFLFSVVHLCALLLSAVMHKQLHTDMPCLAAVLVPYAVAAVTSNEAPQATELLVVLVMLGRLCATLLLSFQLVPFPTSFGTVLRLRTEALLEVMVINTMEYVRLSWLLPLRILLLVGYGLFYRLSGLHYPWLQSMGVHAASLVVSWAVDARYRYIFAKRQVKGEFRSEAALAAGPQAACPAGEVAKEAATAAAQGADQLGAEVQGTKGQQEKQPAGADQQTDQKDAFSQTKQPKQLQASRGSAIVGYLGKIALEFVSLAFTPLPCVLVAIHLVCEIPAYRSGGQTLTMALLKVLSFGSLLLAPACVLFIDWWPALQWLKGHIQHADPVQDAHPKHPSSASPLAAPSAAAGAPVAASAAASNRGAPERQQVGSADEDGSGAGGEQDQSNKLTVVPLYKVQDFAAMDNTEESVRSQESNVRSQLEHINQMVQQKHVYTSRFRRYKVDLKIPGQVDHSLLPADALPHIVSLLSERDFSQRITGTAVRHGCIILSLHMCQEMEQQKQQREEATQAILAVAQTWLQKTHLVLQVPHGTGITLQAGEVQYKLCWQASLHSWTLEGPLHVHEYQQHELRPRSPVTVLPQMYEELPKRAGDRECVQTEGTTSGFHVQQQQRQQLQRQQQRRRQEWQQLQQQVSKCAGDHECVQTEGTISCFSIQQQQQQQQQQWHQQEGKDACNTVSPSPLDKSQQYVLLPIPFSLHSPPGSYPALIGWTEDANPVGVAAATPTADDGFMQLPTNTLSVLACVRGRYLPTQVEPMMEAQACRRQTQEDSVGSEHGAAACGMYRQYKVLVSVPRELARCSYPQTLHLELWRSWGLLHTCSSLIIPASLSNWAAEVQALPPQGLEGDNLGVEPFLLDVVDWLQQCLERPSKLQQHQRRHHHQLQQQLQHRQSEACSEDGELWELGCILARQAVLWGLPTVATLLVETLMALPHPTANPFVQLACAHAHSCGGDAGTDGTAALGGLLHLALLSPCSTTMLRTVLDWGKQRGGAGDASSTEGAECFAWDWEEHNRQDGVTPQELLEQRADGTEVTAAVLQQRQRGEPAVECARGLLAEGQAPKIEALIEEQGASVSLAAFPPSPLGPLDNLPTPFSSGVLPAPFPTSFLPTPLPSSVLLTSPPSRSFHYHPEKPLARASSKPCSSRNLDGLDQWKRNLGCSQDHLTSTSTSSFPQLPAAGASACCRHSLCGSYKTLDGVDEASSSQDHFTFTPTSSFQQLPAAGASACSRHSLGGSYETLDGVDEASGSQDHLTFTPTSGFQQLPAAGASACSRHSLGRLCTAALDGVASASGTHTTSVLSSSGVGALLSASPAPWAQTSPLGSLPSSAAKCLDRRTTSCEPCCLGGSSGCSVFTTPAMTEAAAVAVDSASGLGAPCLDRRAASCEPSCLEHSSGCTVAATPAAAEAAPVAVDGASAASNLSTQKPRQLSAPGLPTKTSCAQHQATSTPSQLQGYPTGPPPTSSAAIATSTPSQLQGQANRQEPPAPASAPEMGRLQPPIEGCAWLMSRVLSPVSSAAPAAADEQQLKQGGGHGAGEQPPQPCLHQHQHQQQQLELNAKGSPIQHLMQAAPLVRALLNQSSSTTGTSSTYNSTLDGSMLNSPLTSVQCISTQASQTAQPVPPLSPRGRTAPPRAHPIHEDSSSTGDPTCCNKPVFLPPSTLLWQPAAHNAVPQSEQPATCQHACNTDHAAEAAAAACSTLPWSGHPATCQHPCNTDRATATAAARSTLPWSEQPATCQQACNNNSNNNRNVNSSNNVNDNNYNKGHGVPGRLAAAWYEHPEWLPLPPPFPLGSGERTSVSTSLRAASDSIGFGSGLAASAEVSTVRVTSPIFGDARHEVHAHKEGSALGVGGGVEGAAQGAQKESGPKSGCAGVLCSSNTPAFRCTSGCAAQAVVAGKARGSGVATREITRAHSQKIPLNTPASPRHKHHHTPTQKLPAAGADVGPQHEHIATAAGATTTNPPHPLAAKPMASGLYPQTSGTASPLVHTVPPKVSVLPLRLCQLITYLGAFLGKCLEHSSWISFVWVHHSLCGFPPEQSPFHVCVDSTSLVPCTQMQQQQQQQQQGMLYGSALPSWSSKVADGEAVAQQQQQQHARGCIGTSSASTTVGEDEKGVTQGCMVGADRPCLRSTAGTGTCAVQQVQQVQAQVGTVRHSNENGQTEGGAVVGMQASEGVKEREDARMCDSRNANLSAAELSLSACRSLEGEYRLWCGRQSNQVAFWYCCFNVSFMLVIMAQSYRGGTLQADIPPVLLWLVPYSCAALVIWSVMSFRMPQVYAEVALVCGNIARILSFLCYGASMYGVLWNIAPAQSGLKALSWRAEVLYELLGGASTEQVRLPWLILLRALTVPPLAFYYSGRGYAWPLFQALMVMVLSIAFSISRDICMRHSFLSSRSLTVGLGTHATCKHVEHKRTRTF